MFKRRMKKPEHVNWTTCFGQVFRRLVFEHTHNTFAQNIRIQRSSVWQASSSICYEIAKIHACILSFWLVYVLWRNYMFRYLSHPYSCKRQLYTINRSRHIGSEHEITQSTKRVNTHQMQLPNQSLLSTDPNDQLYFYIECFVVWVRFSRLNTE